jgi:hypothetical protein
MKYILMVTALFTSAFLISAEQDYSRIAHLYRHDDSNQDVVEDGRFRVTPDESVDQSSEATASPVNVEGQVVDDAMDLADDVDTLALLYELEQQVLTAPKSLHPVLVEVMLSQLKEFFEHTRNRTLEILDLITKKSAALNDLIAQTNMQTNPDLGSIAYKAIQQCMNAVLVLANDGLTFVKEVQENHAFTLETYEKTLQFTKRLHLKLIECEFGSHDA